MSLDRQCRDVTDYADEHGYILDEIYNEGKQASGFDTNRPKNNTLLDHIDTGGVDAIVVPNFSSPAIGKSASGSS